jgi:hypothetical protein
VWSRDGRELLFATPDDRLMSVSYTVKNGSFVPGKPRLWTPAALRSMGVAYGYGSNNYDLAPDGKRVWRHS